MSLPVERGEMEAWHARTDGTHLERHDENPETDCPAIRREGVRFIGHIDNKRVATPFSV